MSHEETQRMRVYSNSNITSFLKPENHLAIGQGIIKMHFCTRPKCTRCGQKSAKTPRAPLMKFLDFSFHSVSLKINSKANIIMARPLTHLTFTINHFLTHILEKWHLFPFDRQSRQRPSISTGSLHFLPLKFRAGRKDFTISLLDPGIRYLLGF